MSDNTQLVDPPGSSNADVIRTIDRTTSKTQVVALDVGGEASESLLAPGNPLPVSAASLPLPTGAAKDSSLSTINTTLGSPLQAGGTVAVSNLPGTQPVSGTVTANQGGAPWTVTPDGTGWTLTGTYANVNVTNASLAVTGTFWQPTQPVSIAGTVAISAASLPLPAGAATSALQLASASGGALETGGNLASLVTFGTFLQRMVDLQVQTLAVLQAMRLQEATAYGASVEPFYVMTDTLN